jgi:hypothetical protein
MKIKEDAPEEYVAALKEAVPALRKLGAIDGLIAVDFASVGRDWVSIHFREEDFRKIFDGCDEVRRTRFENSYVLNVREDGAEFFALTKSPTFAELELCERGT